MKGCEIMVSAKDINDIQSLKPEEQIVVLSLVRSFMGAEDNMNDAQKRLLSMRKKYVAENPMTMEEIDEIIHEEV